MSRFILALLTAVCIAFLFPTPHAKASTDERGCIVERDRLLALDQQAFDQGLTGWRDLARKHCYIAAADVIRDWRILNAKADPILKWHEGQMRANAGDYAQAISLFKQARKEPSEEMAEAWNIYVDGSLAFLQYDRSTLKKSISRLSKTSQPLNFKPVDGSGKPITVPWPPNLAVLEALLRCWGSPYVRAYNCPNAG